MLRRAAEDGYSHVISSRQVHPPQPAKDGRVGDPRLSPLIREQDAQIAHVVSGGTGHDGIAERIE